MRTLRTLSILVTPRNAHSRIAQQRGREGVSPTEHGVLAPVVLIVIEWIKISRKEDI